MVKQGATDIFDSAYSNDEVKVVPEDAIRPPEISKMSEVASNKSETDPKRQEIFFEKSRQFEVPRADQIPLSLFE